jgi:hypothetical protein
MTVCIATLFRWNYATLPAYDFGVAALTVSDRMITIGDIEYEPPQRKSGYLTKNIIGLIAGDYTVHSHCFLKTQRHFKDRATATRFGNTPKTELPPA